MILSELLEVVNEDTFIELESEECIITSEIIKCFDYEWGIKRRIPEDHYLPTRNQAIPLLESVDLLDATVNDIYVQNPIYNPANLIIDITAKV